MVSKDDKIAWIDVETTGLDFDNDSLLQVACIITDANFHELDEGFEQKIYYSREDIRELRNKSNDFVNEMHDKTNLWNLLETEGRPLELVEQDLLAYIVSHVPFKNTARIGGNSITLDRNFLLKNMPNVLEYLHYQSYDMSSVSGFLGLTVPEIPRYEKKSTHDALSDIRESIAEASHYKNILDSFLMFD